MKKSIWMMFAGLLFSALPAFATIQVNLENPVNGTSASGVTVVSGWAFSDSGAAVTVSLRVNGKTTETTVLCCGPRQDVKDAHAAAPLNSGFGLLWNYGVLPSGVHTIGVEVSTEGEEPVIAESSVTVVRPADAEFLESLLIENATVEMHDGTIVITEAEATPTDGTSVKTDLTLSYHVSRQGFGIDMAQDDLGPMQSPYDASELLADVAHTIFATYDALNEAADSLLESILNTFMAGDRAVAIERLSDIHTAWRNARVPWEQSEAFLFGPVDSDGHDPASWTPGRSMSPTSKISSPPAMTLRPRSCRRCPGLPRPGISAVPGSKTGVRPCRDCGRFQHRRTQENLRADCGRWYLPATPRNSATVGTRTAATLCTNWPWPVRAV